MIVGSYLPQRGLPDGHRSSWHGAGRARRRPGIPWAPSRAKSPTVHATFRGSPCRKQHSGPAQHAVAHQQTLPKAAEPVFRRLLAVVPSHGTREVATELRSPDPRPRRFTVLTNQQDRGSRQCARDVVVTIGYAANRAMHFLDHHGAGPPPAGMNDKACAGTDVAIQRAPWRTHPHE